MREESAWWGEELDCKSTGLCVELIDDRHFNAMELYFFAKSILNLGLR